MNTTAKGDSFEAKVYMLLEKLLKNEKLYVPGKTSKIFQKKGYFSKDRGTNIIFDISIETYIPGKSTFSLLSLIECKHYNSAVPVSDVEEFSTKIDQVGQHNTKGVFISNSAFQKGALNFAKSRKLGMVRVKEKDRIEWILTRQDTTFSGDILAADDQTFQAPFAAQFEDQMIAYLPELLLTMGVIDKWQPDDDYLTVPFLSGPEIDSVIDRLNISKCYHNRQLNINLLCENISSLYDVELNLAADLPTVNSIPTLGMLKFNPLEILISSNINDENRRRFTIVHEIAHLVLHLSFLRILYDTRSDTAASLDMSIQALNKTTARLEYQANMFAAHVLLPKWTLAEYMASYFNKNDIKTGFVFVDDQPLNRIALFVLLTDISQRFGVSQEVARVRLKKANLLKDTNDRSMYTTLQETGFKIPSLL